MCFPIYFHFFKLIFLIKKKKNDKDQEIQGLKKDIETLKQTIKLKDQKILEQDETIKQKDETLKQTIKQKDQKILEQGQNQQV